MILGNKIVYIDRNSRQESEEFNINNRNVKAILLKEEMFINTVLLDKKYNIEKILEDIISNAFYNHEVLVHYDILNINKKKYMIVYFARYYNVLKNIVNRCKKVEIIPYQLDCNLGNDKNNINIVITQFRSNVYLIIKIKGIVIYSKNILKNEIEEAINIGIKSIKENLNLDDIKINLYIDKELYCKNISLRLEKIRFIDKEVC